MSDKKSTGLGGKRLLHTKVKTAKGRKNSSTRWLERQLNDPYVKLAKEEGYASRAAYKLLEINEKHHFLKSGKTLLDLGAAPGGWTQVAVKKLGKGKVLALDISPMDDVEGAVILQCDFMTDEGLEVLENELQGRKIDIIVSDMAPAATGHRNTDHLRIIALGEAVFEFAVDYLAPNGTLLMKLWQGGHEHELLKSMRQKFKKVQFVKPPSSRKDSSETFVLGEGFLG